MVLEFEEVTSEEGLCRWHQREVLSESLQPIEESLTRS